MWFIHKKPEEYLKKAFLELFKAKAELYSALKLVEEKKNKERFFMEVTVGTALGSSGTFVLTPDVMVRMYISDARKRIKKAIKSIEGYTKSTRSGNLLLLEDIRGILLECISAGDYREMYEKVSQALSMIQTVSQSLRFPH